MTETTILDESAVSEILERHAKADRIVDDFYSTEFALAASLNDIPALCATVKHLWAEHRRLKDELIVDNIGLNLLRQLVGGKNSLRTLGVFPCNQAEHEDVDCKCFWEQCEAWARQDAAGAPVSLLVCAKCGKTREGVSAETFLCRYCFSTESTAMPSSSTSVEKAMKSQYQGEM